MRELANANWKTEFERIRQEMKEKYPNIAEGPIPMTKPLKGTTMTEAKHAKIQTSMFVRKPFFVEAVQVTADNIYDLAEWCNGQILQDLDAHKKGEEVDYIQVKVHRPLNEKQTKAFIGDWILYAGTGYKVYTNKAFTGCFEPTGTPPVQKEAAEAVGLVKI